MPSTFETARKFAVTLEDVELATSYGTPALKVNGKLFARLWEDEETLVLHMPKDRRAEMIEADPETYYMTDHYVNYPYILVHLSRIHPDALRDLVRGAWRSAAATAKKPAKSRVRKNAR